MCFFIFGKEIALCVTKILNGTRQAFSLLRQGRNKDFPKQTVCVYKQLYLKAVNHVIVTRAVTVRHL